jgi:hypothetical protein
MPAAVAAVRRRRASAGIGGHRRVGYLLRRRRGLPGHHPDRNGFQGIVIIRYAGAPRATGGTVTQVGGFTIHTFYSSGTFTLN